MTKNNPEHKEYEWLQDNVVSTVPIHQRIMTY